MPPPHHSPTDPAAFAAGPLHELQPGVHRIVVIGGGAGGLELAARLGQRARRDARVLRGARGTPGAAAGAGRVEVVLVDAQLRHVWKPSLHELAAGTVTGNETEADFLQQARRHGFRFHLGAFTHLDRARRLAWLAPLADGEGRPLAPERAIAYDTLVMAVGSVVNDFGTPGVRAHALALDSAADARRFHRRLLAACARAELSGDAPVRIAIVGGGATGVELAAELVDAVGAIARYGEALRTLQRPVAITLLEAGPRLLAALPEDLAAQVRRDLEGLGIDVRTGARVAEVTVDGCVLAGEASRVPAQLTVWAAGIQGPAAMDGVDGLALNRLRQLVVDRLLRAPGDERVHALGDCAACPMGPDADRGTVPPRAQAAHQQAAWLARALWARVAGGPPTSPFTFRDQGSLVSVGERRAVGQLVAMLPRSGVRVEGWLGKAAYSAVQRSHLVTLHGAFRAFTTLAGAWLSGRSLPKVKLH